MTHETLKTVFSVYKIGEVIGEGGGGKVRSAQNESGQFFAVKMLDTSKTFPAGKLKRFENECRLGKNYERKYKNNTFHYSVRFLQSRVVKSFLRRTTLRDFRMQRNLALP